MSKKETLNLLLLNVARKEHDADWNWKGVNSPFARIYMVENGSAQVVMPDGVHSIEPGHLYLIPSFVTHSYRNNDRFTLYYVHIYEEQNIFDRLNFPFEVSAGALEMELMKRLLEIHPNMELSQSNPDSYDNVPTLMQNIAKNNQFPFYSVVETKGILLQLFSRFLNNASFKHEIADKRINKAIRYIQENISRDINIGELAKTHYLNPEYFIRLFKKQVQCSPLQYINQKKIEKAQLMLIIGEQSLKEIAFSLSFENMSYFYRLFKKITGVSPVQYRIQSGSDVTRKPVPAGASRKNRTKR
ncbi:MAG: AraC family transcriptional regulator [Bacteroidales bacterium]|jgi:AraC-like DNA-binding protein|nr:AraC family transcriptional regulator [Bacteroidales bacterium]